MPAPTARRLASTALCATLLLGISGPAAMAADHDAKVNTPTPVSTTPIAVPTTTIAVPTAPIPSRNDAQSDALAALRKAVDDLSTAATSGNGGQVMPAATAVMNKLISVLVASVTGGLAMPTLPSLPSLPPSPTTKPMPSLTPKPTVTATPSPYKR